MKARFVPVAMTPVKMQDIFSALFQVRENNKDSLKKFCEALASYFDSGQSHTFTSFMGAIYACLVSLQKIDWQKRSEIILPRYSCPTFAHSILAAGMKIKYCDINPQTLNINLESFEKINKTKVLAVIVTNLFGLSNPIDKIVKHCREKEIYVLEGADYSLGSIYKERRVGAYGDCTLLNFREGKAIPISGGAIVVKNKVLMK